MVKFDGQTHPWTSLLHRTRPRLIRSDGEIEIHSDEQFKYPKGLRQVVFHVPRYSSQLIDLDLGASSDYKP